MRLKGYRTMIFNGVAALLAGLIAALPVIVEVLAMPELAQLIPRDWAPWYALGLALANLWLRAVTTTPVGRSEP